MPVSFVQVLSSGVEAVDCGDRHTMILRTDGSVQTTGCNKRAQLGDGTKNGRKSFKEVISIGEWLSYGYGHGHG